MNKQALKIKVNHLESLLTKDDARKQESFDNIQSYYEHQLKTKTVILSKSLSKQEHLKSEIEKYKIELKTIRDENKKLKGQLKNQKSKNIQLYKAFDHAKGKISNLTKYIREQRDFVSSVERIKLTRKEVVNLIPKLQRFISLEGCEALEVNECLVKKQ